MFPNLGVVCDTSMILVVVCLVVYVAVMLWVLIYVSGFARIICITFVFFMSSVLLLLVGAGLFGEKVEINSAVVEKGRELAVVERSEMTYGLFFYPKISLLLVN